MLTKMSELLEILGYRRGYGTLEEELVIEKHLDVFPRMQKDDFGNRYIVVGQHPTVMFSSHTDTVHSKTGAQKVWIDETVGDMFSGSGDCLGADDGAGMWLMIQMIKAGKRGLYVFHRAEECGGMGSEYIHDNHPELLDGIKYCIAFDRRGYTDVITHQASGRCCSDEFAMALSGALGMGFKPSDRGIFTDSDTYTDLIPECTNISVGYFDEHRAVERLDYRFLWRLLKQLKRINFETLPVIRKPEPKIDYYDKWLTAAYGATPASGAKGTTTVITNPTTLGDDDLPPWDETQETYDYWQDRDDEWQAIYEWVCNHPAEATDILMDNAYSHKVLKASYS